MWGKKTLPYEGRGLEAVHKAGASPGMQDVAEKAVSSAVRAAMMAWMMAWSHCLFLNIVLV